MPLPECFYKLMALILSIETGTEICSVALAEDGRLISLRESDGDRAHAGNLGVYIEEILRENNLNADELDAVAVGAGPGSYTGLRIGTATAKGLCYSTGVPMIAIDSLRSLANIAMEEYHAGILDIDDLDTALLVPMIDARRMEVYTCMFDTNLHCVSPTEAHILTPESFESERLAGHQLICMGNGAAKYGTMMRQAQESTAAEDIKDIVIARINSSARGMIGLAQECFDREQFVDVAYFEPRYLKDFVATQSKRNALGIKITE